MKQTKTSKIALLSILTALSVVLGYIVKIPTPTGILTLLDAGVFFTGFYYGKREGAIVGGLGGFIIDLISGYPHWMKGWGVALTDIPHNLLQNFVGMIVGYLLYQSIKKISKQ